MVRDDNEYVEEVGSFLLIGRSFPLMGSLMTAVSGLAGAAASDLRRDWWAAASLSPYDGVSAGQHLDVDHDEGGGDGAEHQVYSAHYVNSLLSVFKVSFKRSIIQRKQTEFSLFLSEIKGY